MSRDEWLNKCNHWKDKWQVILPEYLEYNHRLDLYAVLDCINRLSIATDVIVGDAGSISYAGPVALQAKQNQKFIFSPAQADMGWALPAAIGVSMAGADNVICITGDGSFMSNVQELAVIRQHNLNIKIVVLNNNGYLSIKNTQRKYFENRVYGTSSASGLWFPQFESLAKTFDIESINIKTPEDLETLNTVFRSKGPFLINCECKEDQEILPAQALKDGKQCGLHDMFPFLSDDELKSEMVIDI